MESTLRILHLEDDPVDSQLALSLLREDGLPAQIDRVDTIAELTSALEQGNYALVMCDYTIPGMNTLKALELARHLRPEIPFVFLSGTLGEDHAIDTLKMGATDYVLKQRIRRLVPAVRRALQEAEDSARRRQAEQELVESRQRLAGIVGSAMDAIISIDADQRIILFNAAAEKMFRCRVLEAIDQPLERFIPERFRTVHSEHVRAFGSSGTTSRAMGRLGTLVALRADGEEFPIEASISQVEVAGEKLFTVILRDVTERKQAEERLQRAKEAAEAASEAKTRFLANISHELRTPMNAILGMVDLALPKQGDPATKDLLKTAKESADLLLVLLNDLLDCAKLESETLELEPAPFSPRQALDHITRVLTVRANEKGLSFTCHVSPEVPDTLVGDHLRLRQVLLNLGSNGVKFTDRGEVALMVSVESQDAEGVSLGFTVRDTGIGIPHPELERVFRPFAQADASTTRRFGGTGLGLSIAASLVDLMGGRIFVESEPGRGSAFHFTVRLPLAERPTPVSRIPDTGVRATSHLHILVVEDNPANQKLAAFMLKERGHTVDVVGDGQQAVSLVRQNRYDVILMDVQMPVMDGLEATKAIRAEENGGPRVPIIGVSAHAMKEDRERCLAAGMDAYLSKPIDAQEVFSILDRLAVGLSPLQAPTIPTEPAIVPTVPVFDPVLALKRCMDSREMLDEMVQYFDEEVDSLFPQIEAALQAGNFMEVGRLGHRLKGTVAYLGAEPATEAAQRVAHFSRHPGQQAEVAAAVATLKWECEVLKATLVAARTSAPARPML